MRQRTDDPDPRDDQAARTASEGVALKARIVAWKLNAIIWSPVYGIVSDSWSGDLEFVAP